MSVKNKPRKYSLVELSKKYANDEMACIDFFFNTFHPDGFICSECGCTEYYFDKKRRCYECKECHKKHYLFANTIFQDNKLDLYKLILGLYLFFVQNKGISGSDMAHQIDVNVKTARLLIRKCRILMAYSNNKHQLDAMFYEVDTIYIGAKSPGKPGMSTDKQPVLAMLSTKRENRYPEWLKLSMIDTDNIENITRELTAKCVLDPSRTITADGKNTINGVKELANVKSQVINYKEENHQLKWLNTAIGNVKENIEGIYHGVDKRSMSLFLIEQEWRYNHRYVGQKLLNKISEYLRHSSCYPAKKISQCLDEGERVFAFTRV